jgi:plastocyanin
MTGCRRVWFVFFTGLLLLTGSLVPAFGGSATMSKSDGAGAASVSGHIRFEGHLPAPTRINMNSDPACSKQHSGANLSGEEFVTGASNTLGNVVVFISDGLGSRSFDVPGDPAVIEQKGCMYEPHVLALRANQKLKVVNGDKTTHNIHPTPANNREWNKAEPADTILEESFPREEVAIPIKCNVHPWMRGYIAVFKHPYFAVTGKDGSFDLHNLPPGDYTVEAWHEKLGTVTQKVTVGAGETKSLDLVFKSTGH